MHALVLPRRGAELQKVCLEVRSLNLRPAEVFSQTRPAGGEGGADSSPPCLTSERRVVERRGKRQTKGFNEADLKSTQKLLK